MSVMFSFNAPMVCCFCLQIFWYWKSLASWISWAYDGCLKGGSTFYLYIFLPLSGCKKVGLKSSKRRLRIFLQKLTFHLLSFLLHNKIPPIALQPDWYHIRSYLWYRNATSFHLTFGTALQPHLVSLLGPHPDCIGHTMPWQDYILSRLRYRIPTDDSSPET